METTILVKRVDKKIMNYFSIQIHPMISLGSFRIKDYRNKVKDTWWYELTFLCFEIAWGHVELNEDKKTNNV